MEIAQQITMLSAIKFIEAFPELIVNVCSLYLALSEHYNKKVELCVSFMPTISYTWKKYLFV